MNATKEKQRRVATATSRCAIYVRISQDRTGAGLGVARQEEDCRAYAERMGWDVVEVYVDNDVSATKRKPRPEYQRLLADVRAGRVDALVVWHIDRLTRQNRELEDVIELHEKYGLELGTVTGDVDLATATGRMMARIIGSTAKYEAEHKSERQRRKALQNAEQGKPHMGGPRPYGYLKDRVTVDPSEAIFIADAAKRVLAGETLRSVAMSMNERGAKTVNGKQWSAPLLRQVLGSARISGRREYRGEVVVTKETANGAWQAIITPKQSDQLRALFADPDRMAHQRGTRATYLLSGLLRCGNCGCRMTALAWKAGGKYLYRCPANGTVYSKATCGKMSVLMKYADPVVRNVVLTVLDSPDLHQRMAALAEVPDGLLEAIKADEEALEQLASEFAAPAASRVLTMAQLKVATEEITARLKVSRAMVARATRTETLRLLEEQGEGTIEEKWDRMNTAQQRAVLAEVLEQVKVMPAPGRGLAFDPKRLVPTYRF